MQTKIGLWFLGTVIGMAIVNGEFLGAALGTVATLFFLTNHFEDEENQENEQQNEIQ